MAPEVFPIRAATHFRCEMPPHTGEFQISRLSFEVPLRYDQPDHDKLQLVAHVVYAASSGRRSIGHTCWTDALQVDTTLRNRPMILYLCGGPGADNPPCRVPKMNHWLLQKGYQVLYLDYRGCGASSPVRSTTLKQRGLADDPQKMAQYITHFGQDNIVRDLEAIRLCLSSVIPARGHGDMRKDPIKWTILGQSYGGYISLTYLSMHPEGLQEVFITGGLPPCGMDIQDYFRVEYVDIVAQNKAFYTSYPDADVLVRHLLRLITEIGPKNIPMSGRGYMSGQKLLTLGRQFGSKVGFSEVYNLLRKIQHDLDTMRTLAETTVDEFESILHVDERPLYPILLEQTWCSGGSTRWAAESVARQLPGFQYLRADENGVYPDPSLTPDDQPIYFTANTYCRFHFDTHEELIDLKATVDLLSEHPWKCPYDFDKLRRNPLDVPIFAISFVQDMHLDLGVAGETAKKVGGLHLAIDPGWHQDIRHKPAAVLDNLFRVREAVRRR